MADNMVTANYPSGVQTFDPNSPARENLVWNPVTQQMETASGAPVSGGGVVDVTGITYDGSNRVTGYTKLGIAHTVTYPTATTIIDTSSGGTITVDLDGLGRVVNVDVA